MQWSSNRLKKDSSSLLRASGMVSPGGAAQAETEDRRPFWSSPGGKEKGVSACLSKEDRPHALSSSICPHLLPAGGEMRPL